MSSWIERTPMPTARHDLQAVASHGQIYAISGHDDLTVEVVEIYEVETDTWREAPPIPTPRGWIGADLLDGAIYVGCGKTVRPPEEKEHSCDDRHFTPRDTLEALDLATNTWSQLSPAPGGPRAGVSVAACGGLLYIIGGNTMDGRAQSHLDVVDVYDPKSGQWQSGTPFPYPVQGTNAVSRNGLLYVFGGHRQDLPEAESYLCDSHVLDPQVGRWERIAPMLTRRESMGITALGDDQIFTCGGHHNLGESAVDHYSDATEIYDIESDSWMQEAPLPERKSWLDAATVDNRVFAMGGANKLPEAGYKWIADLHEFIP